VCVCLCVRAARPPAGRVAQERVPWLLVHAAVHLVVLILVVDVVAAGGAVPKPLASGRSLLGARVRRRFAARLSLFSLIMLALVVLCLVSRRR